MTAVWKTQDGRRIAVTKLEDSHLVSIARMGLKAERRRLLDAAHDTLSNGYAGDDGMQYLADLQYDEKLSKANSVACLVQRLAQSPRYSPILQEMRKRGLRLSRAKPTRTH